MSRMIKSRWKSKFGRFVLDYARREPRDARGHVMGGATLLTQHLGIRPSAIYHSVRAATAPRPVHAAIIQRLARERGVGLTLDQIYGHSRDLRAAGAESLPFRKLTDVVPISRPPTAARKLRRCSSRRGLSRIRKGDSGPRAARDADSQALNLYRNRERTAAQ